MRMRVLTMCCLASLFGTGVAVPLMAAPFQQSVSDSAIPAMPLNQALNAFAQREHLQLVYVSKIADGVGTKGAPAGLSPEATLQKLLEGSGLKYRFLNAKTVTIYASTAPRATGGKSTGKPTADAEGAKAEPANLDTVTVTGTRIRGGTTPSPVITIGSEQIQQEGFTNLGEVIRSVPQNFNGGQNPGVIGVASGVGNQDLTGGSALNLRGLGADASLTLLNGRRLVYDGFSQAVDISAIPVEAVERLEIIPDGASAIYGSDAVGGVANVILRSDFDGVALGVRYGGATDGGLATREYTATAGTTWVGGGLIAAFKDVDVDPIHARQRSYTRHLVEPYTIYGASGSRNGLVSVRQSMGDVAELRLDALRTKRDMTRYISQTGSYYRYSPETSITLVSPSIAFYLRHDWTLTLGGAYGKDENVDARQLVSAAGSRLVTRTCYCNKGRSWEIGAEGPLFQVGGGDARLAVGTGSRKEEFQYVPNVSGSPYGGDERARFAYAELGVPFVSPSSGIPGVHRLEFSAAMRGEDYDSFGRVTTPKLGLIYDPTADFTLKASWGKSFKAPTLLQRYQNKLAFLWSASAVGTSGSPADTTALMSYGGNADLHAERARTWTASLALHPEALPGLEAELTRFDIDYTDRVIEPVNYLQALSNPAYADFVDRSPTPAQIQSLLAVYGSAFYNLSGVAYDPGKVVAIIRDQYVNAARQRIKGIDLSGSYRFDLGDGQLTVRGSASWLDSTQTTSAGQPEHALAGTVFNPARLKGRVGAVWASGAFSASGFVNYTGGVTNRLAAVTEKTASFTTIDTAMNYNVSKGAGAFSGLTLGLSVQNLLNRAPPLYTAAVATYVPYDATNYSAIGRFVSVSVSKRW
ncbi:MULTISPECIES: TonB-dependent receptor [Rhodanobacter]|uniref:TonB-dependent receptor n=1 Tax=Rhodanobacter TaxID=75309 RepID=UPI000A76591C|nr:MULTISPECIES: TonB-dependent receptor [Rhodanobacter]UJJ50967.1 TonB-dependent receptor [Rhodanobacter denitrificans]UJM93680.1 TonB-dependent receptor [Rhodanobacter denitrificans]UJM97211.1 TonB-dependent receptor [Rhodanobacter denitrificans]UJN19961.1 TonB-dependent receptor [Rhodanobacter denitrificans]